MNIYEIFCIEHVLRAAALLIAICQLADGHWNIEARQVLLRGDDLRRQLIGRQDIVEERLRAKLHAACDKFSFGVRVQGGKEGVSPRLPDIRPVEAELRDQQNNQEGVMEEIRENCLPRPERAHLRCCPKRLPLYHRCES